MAHVAMEQGKDTTLLDATQGLEKEVGNLMQLLNIDHPPQPASRRTIDEPEGIMERRVIEVASRLETLKYQVAESAGLVGRLLKAIG